MRNYITILLAIVAILLNSCTQANTQPTTLSAVEFAQKIKELPNAAILDVRTPEEFLKGHLSNALNFDWNGSEFEKQIATLDKAKPVFVYCLSGGRSSDAASKMRSDGFQLVYELNGGMMKWRSANLPETTESTAAPKGMSMQEFDEALQSDKLVLIDFYAEWCAPCKKMKPYLEEISRDMADKVVVIRINVDENPSLCKALKVDALPVLQIYQNKTLTWTHTGYIEKAAVMEQLN